jgi:hypothetical protein
VIVIGLGFGLEVTRKEVGMLVTVRKEMVGTRRLELLTSTVSIDIYPLQSTTYTITGNRLSTCNHAQALSIIG